MKEKIFVIAEIGKNFIQTEGDVSYNEYLNNAKELIRLAGEAGVDAVKFQTHEVEDEQMDINVYSPHFKGSDRYSWVKRNTDITPLEFFKELKKYAEDLGLIFFSTPMSRNAAKKLDQIDVPIWKVGSGDVEDFVMLDYIMNTRKPIIISTGMVSLRELDNVVKLILSKNIPLTVLYCISKYPASKEYFNLSTISYLKNKYPNVTIGFSDHSVGDNKLALSAIKLGARVIEKHFSTSRDHWGSDHKVSMLPNEMKELVNSIRNTTYENVDCREYLGVEDRELEGANNDFRPYFNKAIVASDRIKAGSVITPDMIYAIRPIMYINGLKSNRYYDLIGKKIKSDKNKYEPIKLDDIE